MKDHNIQLLSEIQLAPDEGCIVFDFGCYFPHTNAQDLIFNFKLTSESFEERDPGFEDYKLNHRYPNKNYTTISRKYGRKISKLGYPHVIKLAEQNKRLLTLNVGLTPDSVSLVFPIITSLTKEKRVCNLSFRINIDSGAFRISTYDVNADGQSAQVYRWFNLEPDYYRSLKSDVILKPPTSIENSKTLIYSEDILKPLAQKIDTLWV